MALLYERRKDMRGITAHIHSRIKAGDTMRYRGDTRQVLGQKLRPTESRQDRTGSTEGPDTTATSRLDRAVTLEVTPEDRRRIVLDEMKTAHIENRLYGVPQGVPIPGGRGDLNEVSENSH